MNRFIRFGLAAVIMAVAIPVSTFAGSEDITVDGAWARATIGTSRPGVAYMTLRNVGNEVVVLTAIATPIAMKSGIHETTTNADGVSSMVPAGEITIGPGESVALEPGGLHAMLMMLQVPMIEGESFPLTLVFSDGVQMTVEVPILGLGARGPEG